MISLLKSCLVIKNFKKNASIKSCEDNNEPIAFNLVRLYAGTFLRLRESGALLNSSEMKKTPLVLALHYRFFFPL